jgi:hypothetical protein
MAAGPASSDSGISDEMLADIASAIFLNQSEESA